MGKCGSAHKTRPLYSYTSAVCIYNNTPAFFFYFFLIWVVELITHIRAHTTYIIYTQSHNNAIHLIEYHGNNYLVILLQCLSNISTLNSVPVVQCHVYKCVYVCSIAYNSIIACTVQLAKWNFSIRLLIFCL